MKTLQPASQLLEKFATLRQVKLETEAELGNKETKRLLTKIKKHKPQLPSEVLPNNWYWTSFMGSMEKVVDCHNKTAPYIDEGISLIRTPDIRNGRISLEGTKFISQETYDYWTRRCPPEPGDLIFTREAPMGEAGIVPNGARLCMGQRMMLLRPTPDFINPKYVLLNILSPNFQEQINTKAVGTGVKHLRVADVESLTYPLAPIEEQNEIVRRVEHFFAYADSIEQQVQEALENVSKLSQSIMKKAFSGELTANWRAMNTDLVHGENSALELLKQIKIERKEQAKKRKDQPKNNTGKDMSEKIKSVYDTLKEAGNPLSGQALLSAAGYPRNSSTQQLEDFFLDIRESLESKLIIKKLRDENDQVWFTLAKEVAQ